MVSIIHHSPSLSLCSAIDLQLISHIDCIIWDIICNKWTWRTLCCEICLSVHSSVSGWAGSSTAICACEETSTTVCDRGFPCFPHPVAWSPCQHDSSCSLLKESQCYHGLYQWRPLPAVDPGQNWIPTQHLGWTSPWLHGTGSHCCSFCPLHVGAWSM